MPVTPREHADIERRLWGKTDSSMSVMGRGYAGFWLRFIAALIDGILLNLALFAVVYATGGLGPPPRGMPPPSRLPVDLINFVVNWLYFTLLESSGWQATLGKRLMGIEVTDRDGLRISFWRANGRYWGKILSALTLCIGFLMVGFTRKKQGLHDMVAGTLVIKV